MYLSIRDYGIGIINITNLTNPTVIIKYFTNGGEYVTISKKNESVIIVADGILGVRFIDVTKPTSPR